MANNTIIKTFKILDLISRSNCDLTATDISKQLKIPPSTIHDLLKTLLEEDVIYYKNINKKTYTIGLRTFALSKNYLANSNVINASKNYIKQICDAYNISGYVLKPINDCMLVTYKYESSRCLIKIRDVGYEFNRPIHSSRNIYTYESELNSHIYQICVPIFDYTNKAIGEIKVVGFKNEILENRIELENILVDFSNEISHKLGASPETIIRIYR